MFFLAEVDAAHEFHALQVDMLSESLSYRLQIILSILVQSEKK
jgi:hypothetical protein